MPNHPVVGPDSIADSPILVERTVEIAAPPDAVWPHIADHEAWPEWFTALDRVERVGSGEGVGSGRQVTVKRLKLHEEFTAWEPDRRFAFAVVKSPFPMLSQMAEDVVLEPVEVDGDTHTRVVYRQGLTGKKYVGGLMSLAWKQAPGQLETALANLKTRVESTA